MIAISIQLFGEYFFTTYNEMKIKKYTVPTIHRNKVGIGKFEYLKAVFLRKTQISIVSIYEYTVYIMF
jgi:hypothetical protein